jgi:hypothetical protein
LKKAKMEKNQEDWKNEFCLSCEYEVKGKCRALPPSGVDNCEWSYPIVVIWNNLGIPIKTKEACAVFKPGIES